MASSRLADRAGPLRYRDFRLFWIGHSLSTLGSAVAPTVLALAVVRATGSAAALGLVLGCAFVPRLLLLPIGGVIADRFPRQRVMLVADWVSAAAQVAIGVALLTGAARLPYLAVLSAVGGAAAAFTSPATTPLVAATVPDEARLPANALLSIARTATSMLGPGLAAAMVFSVGAGWAFVFDAATFAVSALTLARLRIPHQPPALRQSLVRDLADGWRELRRHTWYWTNLISHGCWNFANAMLQTLGPLLALTLLGGEGAWLLIVQCGAAGLLAGSVVASRVRPTRPLVPANVALALHALPFAVLALPAPAPVVAAAYGLGLAGLGFLSPVWETVVQQHIPTAAQARVSAYDWVISIGAMPLGYALAATAGIVGTGPLLWGGAALIAVSSLGVLAVPAVRRLGSAAAATGTPQVAPAAVR